MNLTAFKDFVVKEFEKLESLFGSKKTVVQQAKQNVIDQHDAIVAGPAAPVSAPAAAPATSAPAPTPAPVASAPAALPLWNALGLSSATNGKGAVRVKQWEDWVSSGQFPPDTAQFVLLEEVLNRVDLYPNLTLDEKFQLRGNLALAKELILGGNDLPGLNGQAFDSAYVVTPMSNGQGYSKGTQFTDTLSAIGSNVDGNGKLLYRSITAAQIASPEFLAQCSDPKNIRYPNISHPAGGVA